MQGDEVRQTLKLIFIKQILCTANFTDTVMKDIGYNAKYGITQVDFLTRFTQPEYTETCKI